MESGLSLRCARSILVQVPGTSFWRLSVTSTRDVYVDLRVRCVEPFTLWSIPRTSKYDTRYQVLDTTVVGISSTPAVRTTSFRGITWAAESVRCLLRVRSLSYVIMAMIAYRKHRLPHRNGCCLLLSLLSSIFSARFFDTLGLHYCRHNNPLEVCQRKSASNYTQQDETDEMVMMDRRRMAYDAVFLSRMERELMRHGPKSLIDS